MKYKQAYAIMAHKGADHKHSVRKPNGWLSAVLGHGKGSFHVGAGVMAILLRSRQLAGMMDET